jgi:hypothetical protein
MEAVRDEYRRHGAEADIFTDVPTSSGWKPKLSGLVFFMLVELLGMIG